MPRVRLRHFTYPPLVLAPTPVRTPTESPSRLGRHPRHHRAEFSLGRRAKAGGSGDIGTEERTTGDLCRYDGNGDPGVECRGVGRGFRRTWVSALSGLAPP